MATPHICMMMRCGVPSAMAGSRQGLPRHTSPVWATCLPNHTPRKLSPELLSIWGVRTRPGNVGETVHTL